ncbi:hypothetical protein [Microbacterium sp.]|uniref:hypothetical protein n=1 Tax=Microbacterium sp. TaxID=51671 RepID=UPI00391A6EE9
MANGEQAVSAGMDVVLGTDDRRQGYDEDNKTRDYIATRAVRNYNAGGNIIGLKWLDGRVIVQVDITDVVTIPKITRGFGDPSGGQDGDIYLKVV